MKPQAILIFTESVKIVPNDWKVHTSISPEDTSNIIEVTYDQKYGRTIHLYCMAVFENEKKNKYRCVAPWLGKKEIERSNVNDFQTRIIPKVQVPMKESMSGD